MSQYQPKKGEEGYVAVRVTKKQGQAIEPKTELYHPQQVAGVLSLAGFAGDIIYDPRTADQKHQDAPASDTVKSTEPLTDTESYRARYRTLFHEDAPFNLNAEEVKRIVDRAETQLANLAKGVAPVDTDEDKGEVFKAPTDKAGWLALYRAAHPDDTTEDKDLTVNVIREKLGK